MKRFLPFCTCIWFFLRLCLALASDIAYAQVVCNKFEVTTRLTGDTLHLSVNTDLPDSAEVVVSVSRAYLENGKPETYSVDYFSERSTVGNWKSEHTVSVNGARWKKLLREKQEEMSRFGLGFDVASISDKIRVRMVVPIGQADPHFGEGNSQLTGTAVKTELVPIVDGEVEIPFPLASPSVGKSPFPNLNPLGLDNNQTYIVSKKTPLMPSPNPSNPLSALKMIRYIPAGGTFEVLGKWEEKGNPWYRVTAFSGSGLAIGVGWVNSAALLGQKLRAKR